MSMGIMSGRRLVALVALLLMAPAPGSAQALQSFQDLALRVNIDDSLQVEDQSGTKATGRLTRLASDELTIQTRVGERRFRQNTVRAVAVRGHSLRRSALIGAAAFAVLGAVATCAHEQGGKCAVIGLFGAAPIGAGVGLAAGALASRTRVVYRSPEGRASDRALAGAVGAGFSLLEDLALRVNLDDQLRVDDRSGSETTGRLTRLTADELTLQTAAGEKRFTREAVRQVAVRRHPLRLAVLIGSGAGVAAGAVAACTGSDREECVDGPIMAGALGAGIGLAVGALIHKTTVVYPEKQTRTVVVPAVSRDLVGVRVSRRW